MNNTKLAWNRPENANFRRNWPVTRKNTSGDPGGSLMNEVKEQFRGIVGGALYGLWEAHLAMGDIEYGDGTREDIVEVRDGLADMQRIIADADSKLVDLAASLPQEDE